MSEGPVRLFRVGIYVEVEMQGVDHTDAGHRAYDGLGVPESPDGERLASVGGGWMARGQVVRVVTLHIDERPA